MPACTVALADAAPKGDLAVGLGIGFVAAMVGSAVGFTFLVRWLHRHAKVWWRVWALVGAWTMLFGSVLGVIQFGYILITGEVLLQ